MGVLSQYEVSAAAPSTVGGTGLTLKYFGSNPPANLWNVGAPGVNAPQNSAQLGNVPSATSALGQLPFPMGLGSQAGSGKVNGTRFRIYASGTASSAAAPTIQPVVQINTGTVASPSYTNLLAPAASAALTANKPLGWSIAGDLYFDYNSAALSGFMKSNYVAASGGTGSSQVVEGGVAVPVVTGLAIGQASAPPAGVGVGAGFPGFGFVVGVTFGTVSDASNSASLFEFKIIQD